MKKSTAQMPISSRFSQFKRCTGINSKSWISPTTVGCTLKEDQPLRIVLLIKRTALYSVSKET